MHAISDSAKSPRLPANSIVKASVCTDDDPICDTREAFDDDTRQDDKVDQGHTVRLASKTSIASGTTACHESFTNDSSVEHTDNECKTGRDDGNADILVYLQELKSIQLTHTYADRVIFFRDASSVVQSFAERDTIQREIENPANDSYSVMMNSKMLEGMEKSPYRAKAVSSKSLDLTEQEQLTISRCNAWSHDSIDL